MYGDEMFRPTRIDIATQKRDGPSRPSEYRMIIGMQCASKLRISLRYLESGLKQHHVVIPCDLFTWKIYLSHFSIVCINGLTLLSF